VVTKDSENQAWGVGGPAVWSFGCGFTALPRFIHTTRNAHAVPKSNENENLFVSGLQQ